MPGPHPTPPPWRVIRQAKLVPWRPSPLGPDFFARGSQANSLWWDGHQRDELLRAHVPGPKLDLPDPIVAGAPPAPPLLRDAVSVNRHVEVAPPYDGPRDSIRGARALVLECLVPFTPKIIFCLPAPDTRQINRDKVRLAQDHRTTASGLPGV